MVHHLNQPLDVSGLSGVAGVSVSHFHALFKSVTGATPIGFFIGLRMRCACTLFGRPGLNVTRAARLLGYRDRYYFSRIFKSAIGIAPREYRRRVSIAQSQGRPDSDHIEPGKHGIQCLSASQWLEFQRISDKLASAASLPENQDRVQSGTAKPGARAAKNKGLSQRGVDSRKGLAASVRLGVVAA
jgi:AraC-like DNA-binding protein